MTALSPVPRPPDHLAGQAGFSGKPAIGAMRFMFRGLSAVAPDIAAELALRVFLTPQRHRVPDWERTYRDTARTGEIQVARRKVATYRWGRSSRRVLLCHSWGGRATQLGAFVDGLLERGMQAVGFDAPAHGQSDGKRTDMMEYSAAVAAMVGAYGPFDAIIGHSFGAGNALFAQRRHGFDVQRIALIGCFAHGRDITERFGRLLDIPANVIERMRHRLERRYDGALRWDTLDIAAMAAGSTADILLLHDRDDREIPHADAERIVARCGETVTLLSTDGLGHRRILRNPGVVRRVCSFVDVGLDAATRASRTL